MEFRDKVLMLSFSVVPGLIIGAYLVANSQPPNGMTALGWLFIGLSVYGGARVLRGR
jgi:hypothetical protein